jgi:hypothetical protein
MRHQLRLGHKRGRHLKMEACEAHARDMHKQDMQIMHKQDMKTNKTCTNKTRTNAQTRHENKQDMHKQDMQKCTCTRFKRACLHPRRSDAYYPGHSLYFDMLYSYPPANTVKVI